MKDKASTKAKQSKYREEAKVYGSRPVDETIPSFCWVRPFEEYCHCHGYGWEYR